MAWRDHAVESGIVVNFRTTLADIEALPGIVIRLGRAVDGEMRPGRREMLQTQPLSFFGASLKGDTMTQNTHSIPTKR